MICCIVLLGVFGVIWSLPTILFQFRYGAVLPPSISGSTQVVRMPWAAPRNIPKTYSRQVREYFGCYYPEYQRLSGEFWNHFPKALTDVLDEYGAYAQDGKLYDASGREIHFMEKGPKWGEPGRLEWNQRYEELMMQGLTVVIVDTGKKE